MGGSLDRDSYCNRGQVGINKCVKHVERRGAHVAVVAVRVESSDAMWNGSSTRMASHSRRVHCASHTPPSSSSMLLFAAPCTYPPDHVMVCWVESSTDLAIHQPYALLAYSCAALVLNDLEVAC